MDTTKQDIFKGGGGLHYPVVNWDWGRVTQLFGVNASLYKPRFNIPAHNGIDYAGSYGEEVLAAHDGHVTQWNIDDPTRTSGNGIWIQGYDERGNFVQTVYWHLSKFNVRPGADVKAGDVIGYIGNTGFVFPKPSTQCPHCGAHLHFGVARIKTIPPGNFRTEHIPTDYGVYCDPTPFLFKEGDKLPVKFDRDLFWGREGDDVSFLQTILKIEFPDVPFQPIGFFGNQTRLAVQRLQARYGINPVFGYVGPKTRALLSSKYS